MNDPRPPPLVPAAPREVTLEVLGLRLAARAWGPDSGPPVLALHGWLDNAASFDCLAPLLPEVRLLALDFPGHGWSEHVPASASYDPASWLGLPFLIADQQGWGKFSLLGHSMGAAISALCAGALPERIERLTLVEGIGPLVTRDEDAPVRMREYIERERRPHRPHPLYAAREAAVARLSAAVPGLSLDGARRLVERGTREVEGGFVWRADPRLRVPTAYSFTEPRVHAFLRRIAAPTQLFVALDGWIAPTEWLAGRTAQIPQLERIDLPGSHHVHMDRPLAVADAIRKSFGLPA
jgi:pimeloyl-ACP methyl ester carboxylesterase